MTFAIDDGISSGNLNAADICFLVALILFIVAAVLHWPGRPGPVYVVTVATNLGLAAVALGLLLL